MNVLNVLDYNVLKILNTPFYTKNIHQKDLKTLCL